MMPISYEKYQINRFFTKYNTYFCDQPFHLTRYSVPGPPPHCAQTTHIENNHSLYITAQRKLKQKTNNVNSTIPYGSPRASHSPLHRPCLKKSCDSFSPEFCFCFLKFWLIHASYWHVWLLFLLPGVSVSGWVWVCIIWPS